MTFTNSTGSITSRISSSSLRNITSLVLYTFGQYLSSPNTTWEGGRGRGRGRGEGEEREKGGKGGEGEGGGEGEEGEKGGKGGERRRRTYKCSTPTHLTSYMYSRWWLVVCQILSSHDGHINGENTPLKHGECITHTNQTHNTNGNRRREGEGKGRKGKEREGEGRRGEGEGKGRRGGREEKEKGRGEGEKRECDTIKKEEKRELKRQGRGEEKNREWRTCLLTGSVRVGSFSRN